MVCGSACLSLGHRVVHLVALLVAWRAVTPFGVFTLWLVAPWQGQSSVSDSGPSTSTRPARSTPEVFSGRGLLIAPSSNGFRTFQDRLVRNFTRAHTRCS